MSSPRGARAEGKARSFVVVRQAPLNGGPPLADLSGRVPTPIDRFFVRNHGEVPLLEGKHYRLRVAGLVERPHSFSLKELKHSFPRVRLEAALQCAGNRRKELLAVAPVFGEIPWGPQAISNARWAGVRLRDVLDRVGVRASARHAGFVGLDQVTKLGQTIPFAGSVPLAKARRPEVLLAYEMNGRPLPAVHGGPLRVLVPGYIGARSVKWVGAIELTRGPSRNAFQRRTYKRVPAGASARTMERARPIGQAPLNCAICAPLDGGAVRTGRVEVRGYAFDGSGRGVARVEISGDGGATWQRAQLSPSSSPWALRTWNAHLQLHPGRAALIARCFDRSGRGQPASLAAAWNAGGYVNNAWHRIAVVAAPAPRQD